jgi:hypothetical protein
MKQQTKVYSYTRFSSDAQAEGDSERRQVEAARAYAQANGLVLDETLRMIDKGLSGYHGAHRKKGALGAFLEQVKGGHVPPGSILLVENLDRLSREPVLTAMQTVIDLLKHNITIQTLNPPDSYTTASVNNNGFWRLVAHIDRANGESQRKHDLAQATWKQKRAIASADQMLTARAPAWLKIIVHKVNDRVVGRDVSVIPEAAETVKLIFKLKLEGFGKGSIEKKLNQSAPWTPPKNKKGNGGTWRASFIEKILRSRAIIGEFQPHTIVDGQRTPVGEPIVDYFPAIVSAQTFHAVQQRMKEHHNRGGKTGAARNVLKNLVTCGYCGGSVTFLDKGDSPKGGKYLVCENGRRGVKCSPNPVPYAEVEQLVLDNCSRLRPEMILPTSDEHTSEVKKLRLRIEGLGAEAADLGQQMENFIDQIGKTSNATLRAKYELRIAELDKKKVAVEGERTQAEASLHQLEQGLASFQAWEKNLAGLKKAILKDVDSRIKLNAHLKEFVGRIEVFAQGAQEMVEHAEEFIYDNDVPALTKSPAWKTFKKYLSQRLLSSAGRFLKLHFITAKRPGGVNLAPAGSLAARVEIKGKEWKFSSPDVVRLMGEFFDSRKPGFVPKASALAGHTKASQYFRRVTTGKSC